MGTLGEQDGFQCSSASPPGSSHISTALACLSSSSRNLDSSCTCGCALNTSEISLVQRRPATWPSGSIRSLHTCAQSPAAAALHASSHSSWTILFSFLTSNFSSFSEADPTVLFGNTWSIDSCGTTVLSAPIAHLNLTHVPYFPSGSFLLQALLNPGHTMCQIVGSMPWSAVNADLGTICMSSRLPLRGACTATTGTPQ